MRAGKKRNKAVEVRQTRSCVVRLEKVSTSPNLSPSLEENRIPTRNSNHISSSVMTPTLKGRKGISLQRDGKANSGNTKKKIVSRGTNVHGNFQTPQAQKSANISMSNIKLNQKIKTVHKSNKSISATTPTREESPPPTIAAGRSRRAIKPNPKYASEDMVTPKVVRNVGMLGSSGSRRRTSGQNKTRKISTSSEDFYNRNSEDEFDNFGNNKTNDDNADEHNDEAYQASEKDDQDSDFYVVEETSKRNSRSKGRPKKIHDSTQALKPQIDNKLPTQTRSTVTAISSNLRSAPSQLQQIRRSLASANAQRSLNSLSGCGAAQKRKLEEIQDCSDNESNNSSKRKQLLLSNSSGHKVKIPVRENKVYASSTPLTKTRITTQTNDRRTQMQQAINGSNKNNNVLASSRKTIEISLKSNSESISKSSLKQSVIAANISQHNKSPHQNSITTQAKILASKSQNLRSGSPRPALQKEKQNNEGVLSLSSSSCSTSKTNNKIKEKAKSFNTQSNLKTKITIPTHNAPAIHSEVAHEIKDDSPNSTMDDFETMPTFTIVNVNDIINKKGDVLITKSKSNSNKAPTVIELSESISLDDDDDEDNMNINDVEEVESVIPAARQKQILLEKLPKSTTLYHRNENGNKKFPLTRSNDSSRKLPTQPPNTTISTKKPPQILNHKLGLNNSRVTAKTTTTLTATLTSPDKPAPRILNSVVAKKTQPVKPMIANMEDSADESFLLSLDEDEEEDPAEQETEDELENVITKPPRITSRLRKKNYQNLMEIDTEDTDSQNTEEDDALLQNVNTAVNKISGSLAVALGPKETTSLQRRKRAITTSNTPLIVSSNQKRLTPAAAKENSLAATNQQVNDTTTKQPMAPTLPIRKSNTEKVVISKQGDKIIKKITCFETWYVVNMPVEPKRPAVMKNQLEMPLIQLANQAKNICLPNNMWSCKVTLNELSQQSLVKTTFITYTGELKEHNISEEDREKYQPFCVMFRRSIEKNQLTRMPYDRAVIFKNKTFYTNIEGKNIRLLGAPSVINCESEIEILLEIVDRLTLQSDFVELISVVQ